MSEYTLSQVSPTDKTTLAEIDALLQKEGIRRDGNLDYICAMFDEDYHVIGTAAALATPCGALPSAATIRARACSTRSSPTSLRCSAPGATSTCFCTPR